MRQGQGRLVECIQLVDAGNMNDKVPTFFNVAAGVFLAAIGFLAYSSTIR